jgi:hypothetical protein
MHQRETVITPVMVFPSQQQPPAVTVAVARHGLDIETSGNV